mmetsp:Transcript_53681/g.142289  ORF Transcript_53681/g.142289 Transcript_53681/m.142289 type:complete len:144 (+) Transcript_53681:631-1062(+)
MLGGVHRPRGSGSPWPMHSSQHQLFIEQMEKLNKAVTLTLAATILLCLLTYSAVLVGRRPYSLSFEGDVGRLRFENDPQVDFVEFKNMCLKACRNDPDPLGRCTPSKISGFWTSYQDACTKNRNRCALTSIGCGGEWRPDMLN